jgi:hypothetical protein
MGADHKGVISLGEPSGNRNMKALREKVLFQKNTPKSPEKHFQT